MGAHYLVDGFKLILQPKLRRFVYIPLLINVIIFVLLWWLAMHELHPVIAWVNSYIPSWLHWLDYVFWVFAVITVLLVSAYVFTWLANLIAAPFYALLSESVQSYLNAKPLPESTYVEAIQDIPRSIKREFAKLFYYLPRAIVLFILSFVPGLNLIITVLWFVFGSWMQALQYLDYPMDNNKHSFKELKTRLKQHKLLSFGFGAGVMLLMMVPLLNIILMPAAVAGATKLYLEQHND